LESSVWGAVISVVRSLAFTGIHSHRLAMAFARRLAASPSMGRTVVSPITIAHLLSTSVTSLYEGDTQHAFGQKCTNSTIE
jgi:hypothetical protein